MIVPGWVASFDDFNTFMASSTDQPQWALELRDAAETLREHEQLCSDLQAAIDKSDIEVAKGASLQDGLEAIMDRYTAVRDGFSEWFDHDIAEEGHKAETTAILKRANGFDDFRFKVRAVLVKTGALTADGDDAYALALLAALLGVEV